MSNISLKSLELDVHKIVAMTACGAMERDGHDASCWSGYRIRHCSRTTLLRDVLL